MVKISVTLSDFSLRKDIDSLYATAFKLLIIVLFIFLSYFNSILRSRIAFTRSVTVFDFIASIFSELNEKALSQSKFSASASRRLVLNFEFLERIDYMPDYLYLLDYLEITDLLVSIPLRSEGCLFDILDYCYLRRKLSL